MTRRSLVHRQPVAFAALLVTVGCEDLLGR